MHNDLRVSKAQHITTALLAAESALEMAIADSGAIITALTAHRVETGLSVLHGQEALEEAMAVTTLLTQARRSFGGLHRKLEATGRQVGVPTRAGGPTEKPPTGVEQGDLRRVA
jgi:hypothetical protein